MKNLYTSLKKFISRSLKKKTLRSRRGVALLLVMASTTFMAVIITEVIAASRIDLLIAMNARNRLQAHYMAASSAKLQILRLHIYKEVKNMTANLPLPQGVILDQIWSSPMPPLPLDKAKSKWPGELQGSIQAEGSKIPINMLDGSIYRYSSPAHVDEVKTQLTALIEGMLETEEFDKKYRGLDPKDLIDPLIDWIDSNEERIGGGEENREYERLDPPYKTRNDRIPSLSELHLVQGWTDDLYRRIVPNLSVINRSTAVNPNYVPLARIRSWAPDLTDAELALIDKRRRLQPFSNMQDLVNYISGEPEIRGGKNMQIPQSVMQGSSDSESYFMIEGTGIVGDTRRGIRIGVIVPVEPDTYKRDPRDPNKYALDADGKPIVEKKGKLLLSPQVVFVEEFI